MRTMAEGGVAARKIVIDQYVRSLHAASIFVGTEKVMYSQLKLIRDCVVSLGDYVKFLKRVSVIKKWGEVFIAELISRLELSKEVSNFLALLLKNGRFALLVEICDEYFSFISDVVRGEKIFHISYAANLTKFDKNQLVSHLQEIFGGKIRCVCHQDPSLIGGICVRHRSKILDYSLKSKLGRLRRAIRGDCYEN
ncbi:MAG: ATP synthase F1 subunit delta [Holosporaceae bacterium]|jgi:F-type H+-transporting ATPase subunit delta|nr:ATP synthase F1 subunit delta [Holosporaceae bacterium]